MRIWRATKASNRPWPVLDEDPVIDFQILEAVAVRAAKEEDDARKRAEREEWKKNRGELEQFA